MFHNRAGDDDVESATSGSFWQALIAVYGYGAPISWARSIVVNERDFDAMRSVLNKLMRQRSGERCIHASAEIENSYVAFGRNLQGPEQMTGEPVAAVEGSGAVDAGVVAAVVVLQNLLSGHSGSGNATATAC